MEELEKNEINETFDVDANQLKIINLVLNCYDNEFAKKVNENKSINFDDYMVDNSIRKSTYAKQFSIYCMENEITPKELSVNDLKGFMEEYYNDFEAVDNVVNPDELCNSIREIISTHTKENVEENSNTKDITALPLKYS